MVKLLSLVRANTVVSINQSNLFPTTRSIHCVSKNAPTLKRYSSEF